jgi:hypothetical protein
MSFIKSDIKHESTPTCAPKPCTICHQATNHEDLMKYGSRCFPCFAEYCKQRIPNIQREDKYRGDPRGWARRIIDRHTDGEPIRPVTLRFAQEALGLEKV